MSNSTTQSTPTSTITTTETTHTMGTSQQRPPNNVSVRPSPSSQQQQQQQQQQRRRRNNEEHGERGKDHRQKNIRHRQSNAGGKQQHRGKRNNSNQRSNAEVTMSSDMVDNDAGGLKGKPPPKVVLLKKSASDGEQQQLLSKFAAPGKDTKPPVQTGNNKRSGGNKRQQGQSPKPTSGNGNMSQQLRTPPSNRRANKKSKQHRLSGNIIHSPTPRKGTSHMGSANSTPANYHQPHGYGSSSPMSRFNHYAGATFNNSSPAPNTLPLPPSFLASSDSGSNEDAGGTGSDEDVFERPSNNPQPTTLSPEQLLLPRQLYPHNQTTGSAPQFNEMVAMHGSHSSVDLSQGGSDMNSMFQKLRLIKEMAQNRPASVGPVVSGTGGSGSIHQLTPVYYNA